MVWSYGTTLSSEQKSVGIMYTSTKLQSFEDEKVYKCEPPSWKFPYHTTSIQPFTLQQFIFHKHQPTIIFRFKVYQTRCKSRISSLCGLLPAWYLPGMLLNKVVAPWTHLRVKREEHLNANVILTELISAILKRKLRREDIAKNMDVKRFKECK
jgi:hypothetical protein